MTATDRITLVVLNDNGTREKFTLSSWVGIPRKHELLWIGDDPFMVIEVEYAVSEGFFGASLSPASAELPIDAIYRTTTASVANRRKMLMRTAAVCLHATDSSVVRLCASLGPKRALLTLGPLAVCVVCVGPSTRYFRRC